MHDPQLLIFLLSLAVLLGAACILGAIATRIGCPAVVGEIAAGIVVGKTVLGRCWPEAFAWLFRDGPAATMLQGYKALAIVLLMVVAGLEMNTGAMRRIGKALAWTAVLGAAIPFVLGYGLGLCVPDAYLADPSQRSLLAVFLGIALAISALPVITRTLLDLGLLRTEFGALVLSVAVLNDIVGWVGFSALVGAMTSGSIHGRDIVYAVAVTLGCLALALVIVRPVADRWLGATSGEGALSIVLVLALLAATATELLGLHAVFGGFLVGFAIGGSANLPAQARRVLELAVTRLFTPVFFAAMALRYDFIHQLDLGLVVAVTVVAMVSKVCGSALGARLGGLATREALAIGFGLSSRGAMEIILATLALEAKIIGEPMFVALVLMALTTSIVAGPMIRRLLRDSDGAGALRTVLDAR
ncbi:MAG: cation:proton antiporter [Kofleriaceae bacterium]